MDDLWTTVGGILATCMSESATEVAKEAWTKLVGLVRKRFAPEASVSSALEASEGSVDDIVEELRLAAGSDPEFAQSVREWASEYRVRLSGGDGSVENTVSGRARVKGSVVQARDIGNVHF